MKKMLNEIIRNIDITGLVRTNTFKQTSIVFSGTLVNGLLGAIFYIVAARILGPASYGLLGIALTTLALVADIGDFGTNTGLVRFISKYAKVDTEKSFIFQNLGIKIKIVVSLTIFILGFLLSPIISHSIFAKPDLVLPLRIAFLGVISTLLFSFVTVSLQAFEKYWAWSGIQITTNSLRLLLIIILYCLGRVNYNLILSTYIVMPLIGFFIGLYFIPSKFIKTKSSPEDAKEFFKYTKWVGIFLVISSLGSRLDSLISARLLTVSEMGFYAAATQLVFVFPQLVSAIGTVISPKLSSMGSFDSMLRYYKKIQLLAILLFFAGLLVIPAGYIFIPLIYGSRYSAMAPVFSILVVAMLIFLLSAPINNTIIYYYSYPKLFSFISIIHLLLVAIFGFILIREFGVLGGAFSVLIAQTFDFIIPAIWLYRKICKKTAYVLQK